LLKVYSGGDSTLIERFEREAKIVADLNSSAVVAIYDFGEEDGNYFISMEYIEGKNLNDYLSDDKLSSEKLLDFVYQISSALSVLHKKGYIHRDLKPENILVDQNDQIKLTDFGLSINDSIKRVTSEGALLGTPLYMSPEQINNIPLTCASDIFSLGTIFYQMSTQANPFDAPKVGEIFSKILTTAPAPANKTHPDIPEWLSTMIDRMLVKEPEKRIQNATQILKIIEKNDPELIISENNIDNGNNNIFVPITKWAATLLIVGLAIYYFAIYEPVRKNDQSTKQNDSLVAQQNNNNITVVDSSTLGQKDTTKPDNSTQNVNNQEINPIIISDKVPKLHYSYTTINAEETLLLIQTSPWCNVLIDYQQIDKTPMTQPLAIKPGKYLLSLQNPLYPSLSDSIVIAENKKNIYDYNLDSSFYKFEINVIPWPKSYRLLNKQN